MKKHLFIIIIMAAVLSLAAASQITLERISGRVQISRGDDVWSNAEAGMILEPGTLISTGFRSIALLNTGDATVEVAQLTRLTLEDIIEQEDSVKTTLFLNGGKIKANVSRERIRQDFTVRSPIATASVRGTGFTFTGRTLQVDHGAVLMLSREGAVLALPGDGIKTDTKGNPKGRLASLEEQSGIKPFDLFPGEGLPGPDDDDPLDEIQNALLAQLESDDVFVALLIQ